MFVLFVQRLEGRPSRRATEVLGHWIAQLRHPPQPPPPSSSVRRLSPCHVTGGGRSGREVRRAGLVQKRKQKAADDSSARRFAKRRFGGQMPAGPKETSRLHTVSTMQPRAPLGRRPPAALRPLPAAGCPSRLQHRPVAAPATVVTKASAGDEGRPQRQLGDDDDDECRSSTPCAQAADSGSEYQESSPSQPGSPESRRSEKDVHLKFVDNWRIRASPHEAIVYR